MRRVAAVALGAVVVVGAVVAACKSGGSGPLGGREFDDLSREEQVDYMKTIVLPTMHPMFRDWEPDEFQEMTCAACHGKGAQDRTFEMPNPDLPRLPGGPDGFERLMAEEPEATTFMAQVVVPRMAALLGEKPYDPETKKGFGCFDCHMTE